MGLIPATCDLPILGLVAYFRPGVSEPPEQLLFGAALRRHQFCTVGEHSFTSFASHVTQSIPPYVTVSGEKARARGVNIEGLKRRGYSSEQIKQVRRAYRVLYRSELPLEEARVKLDEMAAEHDEIKPWVEFLDSTEKSFIR